MFEDDFGGFGSSSGFDEGFIVSGSGRFDDAFDGCCGGGFTRSYTTGGDDLNHLMGTDVNAEAWGLPTDSTFWANSDALDAANWSSNGLAGFLTDIVVGANQFLSRWTKYEP